MANSSLTIANVTATVAIQSNKVYPPQVVRGFYFLRSGAADKRYSLEASRDISDCS